MTAQTAASIAIVWAAAAASANALLPPAPPAMTPWQTKYMEGVSATAKAASAAARPALLRALDDVELRAGLGACCAGIATLPAPALLEWWHAQTDVSEMVHNFNAAPPAPGQHGHGGDPPLDVYGDPAASWFYNLWEICPGVLNLTAQPCGGPEDAGETGMFGMPEFANGRTPTSLEEAEQRPVYTAFNSRMVDAGNQHFGDVSMVYSPEFVRPMTIIAPMDTGMWTMTCNKSFSFPPPPPCSADTNASHCHPDPSGWGPSCRWINASGGGGFCAPWGCANGTTEESCAAVHAGGKGRISCSWIKGKCTDDGGGHHHHHFFGNTDCEVPDWNNGTDASGHFDDFKLGTLEHYDHLLLAGASWWNQSVAAALTPLFHRMYNSSDLNISSTEQFRYWEADIAGAVLYPDGIKMVIGVFPSLFGTAYGEQLQRWCTQHSWPLLWALGTNSENTNSSANGPPGMGDDSTCPMDSRATRMLDPVVFAKSTAAHNTTLPPAAATQFAALWKTVAAAKAKVGGAQAPTAAQYAEWYAQLPAQALRVKGLLAADCADASSCIGTTEDGHCVCAKKA